MIFVKETRPRIVEDNPDLGALDIMKKVGQYWQQLLATENGTKEFQDKADIDKLRYLKEQQEFYDEVGRIKGKGELAVAEAAAAALNAEEDADAEDGALNAQEEVKGGGQQLLGAKRLHSELKAPTEQMQFAAAGLQAPAGINPMASFEWK